MWSPTGLNVGDDFSLEPSEISVKSSPTFNPVGDHIASARTVLNVGDDFALEPSEISVDGQHYEKKNADLGERDEDFRVLGEEVVHDLASASCRDSIMVQKRVRVPVVKRVSCAERISPAGTS